MKLYNLMCFVKYCADMSRRNTSQIPSEQDRSDRLRAGRIAPTGSVRREKEASRPPMAGRGRGGGTRIARDDAAGGSSSHTGPSQTVDPTQYQVYEHPHGHEYQFEDPQPHQYQFDAYQQHQYHHEEPAVEEPQQHEEAVVDEPPARFQGVPRVVYEAGPDGYAGGPSDLRLLPDFGGHVACRIWVDADVSII